MDRVRVIESGGKLRCIKYGGHVHYPLPHIGYPFWRIMETGTEKSISFTVLPKNFWYTRCDKSYLD